MFESTSSTERLRRLAERWSSWSGPAGDQERYKGMAIALTQALDALTELTELRTKLAEATETARRLEQANGDLRRERDRAVEEAQRQDAVAKGLRAERDALAADNARLRKALEGIAAFAEEDISELTGVAGQMVCFFCGYVPHEEKCPHTITTAALAATPAQSLAAHNAAMLREVADREFNPEQSAEERWAHGVLHGNADRIEKEAVNG